MKLDLARRLLSHDSDRARNEIVEAEQTARSALAEVREAVSGYRAEGLDAEISRARRSLLSADVKLTTTLAPVNLSSSQVDVLCLELTLPMASESSSQSASRFMGEADTL
jgi:two-component system sensor histidine kinase DesK